MVARKTPARPAAKKVAATKKPAITKAPAAATEKIVPGTHQINARFDAGGRGRRFAKWNPGAHGPANVVKGTELVRDRARDSVRNDWASTSGVAKWATNLVGVGITPRFKRLTAGDRKQKIIDLYNDFVQVADADGVLNFYGLQTLCVRGWFESGEVFVRMRPRSLDAGLPVPLQLQVLESDFCPSHLDVDAGARVGLPANHVIRQGIEFNKFGRRMAYWFYKNHPGDRAMGATMGGDADLVRVPASQVCHIFEPKRPGQLRGVSELAGVLAKLREVADFEDAVLLRQKIGNLFVAFIKSNMGESFGDVDPLSGAPLGAGSGGEPIIDLAPGIIQELDPGQDVAFANPPEAGTEYGEYFRASHIGTSAGQGLPYELLTGDIRNVSDRTLRVIINDFRRFAEQRQWQIVIPMLCVRVIGAFADAAVLAGLLSEEEADAVRRAEWSPHGWAYIHPVQDPQGKKLEVEAGFRSRSSVIGERGDDPDMVDSERAADMAREKELDLWVDPNPQPAAGDGDGIDNEEYTAPPNAA